MLLLLFAGLAFAPGCATVGHGPFQSIPVSSDPIGATVEILGSDAEKIEPRSGRTPMELRARRTAEDVTVRLTHEGYAPAEVRLERRLSNWVYWDFAIVGAGAFAYPCRDTASTANCAMTGMLINAGIFLLPDFGSGSSYRLRPYQIVVTLEPEPAQRVAVPVGKPADMLTID